MNPVLAPRRNLCMVCVTVADLSDIAIRIWDEDGERIPAGTWRAAEYLMAIGVEGPKRNIEKRLRTHVRHVEEFLARPSQAIAPMQLIRGGKRSVAPPEEPESPDVPLIPARMGPARWVDVQQNAMEVGTDALALIASRLQHGGMEDKDLIAVAKLGVATAGKRGDLEAKGRRLNQVDELLRMAAGMRPDAKEVGPGTDHP